jgi:hypothetical protein
MAVDHWRAYHQPTEFITHTDQKSLIYLEVQTNHHTIATENNGEAAR